MAVFTTLGPLLTAHLFPTLDAQLIDLLRSLAPDEWERQTIAPGWKVKDIAADLLDTQLRRLSFGRDGYTPSPPRDDRENREHIQDVRAQHGVASHTVG